MKRLLLLIMYSPACPLLIYAGTPFLEITAIKDSAPNTKFYLNTYAVFAPLADGRVFVTWTAAERWPVNSPPFHCSSTLVETMRFQRKTFSCYTLPQRGRSGARERQPTQRTHHHAADGARSLGH